MLKRRLIKTIQPDHTPANTRKRVLVAAAWPYANGPRHIGHLSSFGVPADVFARYHRLAGSDVLFVSGTDEHGTPISVAAESEGVSPRVLADTYNAVIREDLVALGLSYDLFTRTTTSNHAEVVKKVFAGLRDAGYIVERKTVGAFAPDGRALPDRYVEGTCPHCGGAGARGDQCDACGAQLDPAELINASSIIDGAAPVFKESTHLFLDLPALAQELTTFLSARADDWRPNVANLSRALVAGLRPRAITRDLDWGVPVPQAGYENKRFYVWFDAVIGYLSASIEWARRRGEPDAWRQWWNNPDAEHSYFLGKDNIVFHTLIWPAILSGCGGTGTFGPLHLPDEVAASEFLTVEGRKFSSSRGVVLYVRDFLKRYQPDALRYYLVSAGPETRDTDFTWDEFVRRTNDELVATWGNLVQRVLVLAQRSFGCVPEPGPLTGADEQILEEVEAAFASVGALIERCRFKAALAEAFGVATLVNRYFHEAAPWLLVDEDRDGAATVLYVCLSAISDLRLLLAPFLPFSCQSLHKQLGFPGSLSAETRNNEAEALLELSPGGVGRWGHEQLPTGVPLGVPRPLFTKLAPDTAARELQRLRGTP